MDASEEDSHQRLASDKPAQRQSSTGSSYRWECFEERANKILVGAIRALDKEHQDMVQELEERNKRLHSRVQSLSQEVASLRRRIGDPTSSAEVAYAFPDSRTLFQGDHLVVVDVDTGQEDTQEATTLEEEPGDNSRASTPAILPSTLKAKLHKQGTKSSHFQLLAEWQDATEELAAIEIAEMANRRYHAGLQSFLDERPLVATTMRPRIRRKTLILDPASPPRIVWDLLAGLVLSTEICLIPMAVFDLPEDGAAFVLNVIMMMYWTLDIPGNFMVGYHKSDGEVVFTCKKVAFRYMKSWFMLDILLVITDWLTTGMKLLTGSEGGSVLEGAGLLRIGKVARLVRLVRVLRIVRLGKMRAIIQHLQDMIDMENTAIMFSIAKNLAIIVLINHFMACAWFFVGKQTVEGGWLQSRLSDQWYENYLISIHWSISNFTPGSSPVQPVATAEILLAVVILFFALVVFSVFVSSTTSLISRLVGLSSQRNKQLWVLRGFLKQNKFDVELRDRVLRYVKIALGARRDVIQKDDVDLLNLLSQPLREEVQMNLQSRTLNVHPFFKMLSTSSYVLMRKICVEALVEVSFSRGDQIFNIGEVTDRMGIVCHGVLGYNSAMNHGGSTAQLSQGDSLTDSTKTNSEQAEAGHRLLREKDTYCEAVLWTNWHCRGLMQADGDCSVVDVVGSEFRKNVKKYQMDATVIKRYAEAFIIVLNMAHDGLLEGPLDDLQANFLFAAPIQEILEEPWMIEAVDSDGPVGRNASSDSRRPERP